MVKLLEPSNPKGGNTKSGVMILHPAFTGIDESPAGILMERVWFRYTSSAFWAE